MGESDYKLIIVEGEKREIDIFERVETFFIQKEKFRYINLPANQNIYMLWQLLKADDFQTDIVEIIRETVDGADKVLEGVSRDNIAEVFLFFDLDAHQNNISSTHNQIYSQVVEEMLEVFDNETELGKLYISYPMIEALRDLSAKGCSTYTSSCQIDNAKLNDYKMLSGNGNILGNTGKYGVEEWRLVIKSFAVRLSCLLSLDEVISYDDYKKRVSPATIFYNQQRWFEKAKTFILSAVPEFLLDYFGLSFWKRYIRVKKINKKFCKGQMKKGR